MSESGAAQFIIKKSGVRRELGAFVVAARFDRGRRTAAFALGDGTVRLVELTNRETWREVAVHEGAVLSLAPDAVAGGFVSAGDDGRFRRVADDGAVSDLASFGMKWVEQAASYPGEKGKGLIACSVGKIVHLFNDAGEKLKELPHPSSVPGLAFDGKGKRIGASHYNGVSLWFVAAKTDSPRRLEWKGSHIAIAIHPEGDAAVTAMQENSLHGWTLPEGKQLRMSGYPSKTQSLSFSRTGKWLATSGADAMVLWPFFGGGPMGKAPMELAGGDGVLCTQAAFHPRDDLVAGGFADGLVVLADVGSSRILSVAPPGNGPISALAWSADGGSLA
ncbi:MAG: WD40 repeat domain-containing protein, partial [Pseudomonadota bacterium]|nr:WD40 repeat domain-containing protein [Pseudomonadota bacterium]